MTTHPPAPTRVTIIIDVHHEPLLTVAIWARLSAHTLTDQLGHHGVVAHVATVKIDAYPTPNY
jgi:hypothetical protein